jgi:hypothetical protein
MNIFDQQNWGFDYLLIDTNWAALKNCDEKAKKFLRNVLCFPMTLEI